MMETDLEVQGRMAEWKSMSMLSECSVNAVISLFLPGV